MLAGLDGIGGFVSSISSGGGTSGSFAVDVTRTNITKSGVSSSPRTLTTTSVTVTASGGAGGYSYSWARIAGDSAITAGSSTAAATTFSAACSPGDTFSADFVCTVTDASGAHLTTDTVSVTITLDSTL